MLSHSVMSDSWQPHSLPGSSVHGILQARILKWVAIPSSKGSSQSRDWTQVSLITSGFLPSEPLGKPRNTGVGSLSLLQCIFLTQGLNCSLLNYKRILYQLSNQGIPEKRDSSLKLHRQIMNEPRTRLREKPNLHSNT